MIINTKVRYGLRAMIEIGRSQSEKGTFQKDIAKSQQISEKYLDPIISSLKTSGLIKNYSGKKSGYILNKSVGEITALDIFRSFEHDPELVPCALNSSICERSDKCAARELWAGMNELITNYLQKVTLEDLCLRFSCENNKEAVENIVLKMDKGNLIDTSLKQFHHCLSIV